MDIKKLIKFIKNSNETQLSEFVDKRLEYLYKKEAQSEKKYPYQVKPYPNNVVLFRYFLDEKTPIVIGDGLGDYYAYHFDINEELSTRLFLEIQSSNINNINDICSIVSNVVFNYFGGKTVNGTIEDRLSHVVPADYLQDNEKNFISSFKDSGNAWCMERATATHQMFKMLGIESQIIISSVIVDGKRDVHAFNMIRMGENTFLLDTSMIDYSQQDNYNPIFQVLPYESFDTLEGVTERTFVGKDNQTRSCVINPQNKSTRVFDVEKEMTKNN